MFSVFQGFKLFLKLHLNLVVLQKNVDEAVEKLKSKGIEAFGLECHVSSADQRKRLMESAVEVREAMKSLCCLSSLSCA